MIPLVLSGGSGTRLWPVSRPALPKQFCSLFEESLLVQTLRRLEPFGAPRVVTTRSLAGLTQDVYRERNLPANHIFLEPYARNTAAAIALACRRLPADAVVGIFPADHFIENVPAFQKALRLAEQAAASGAVVTLGIHPTWPATGYGYIELSENQPYTVCPALRFREKPAQVEAEAMLATGRFVWNAGIFVFRVDQMIAHLSRLVPALWEPFCSTSAADSELDSIYGRIPSVSIDVAVMEHLQDLVCVPCAELGWSDVGSWDEVARLRAGDSFVNVGASNCFVLAPHKTVALVGVEDVLVVDTPEALLVMKRGMSQAVKEVVAAVPSGSSSVV